MSAAVPSPASSRTQEFLTFRRMLTPVIIQIVFWIGIAFIVLGSLGVMVDGSAGFGFLLLVVGPVIWRVYVELLVVIFRIHSGLEQANASLAALVAAGRGPVPPASPAGM